MIRTAVAIFLFLNLTVTAQNAIWQPKNGLKQVAIWPGLQHTEKGGNITESMHLSKNKVGGYPWHSVENVTCPTYTIFPAQGNKTDISILVFPGGGYRVLAIDLEGTEICEWLASNGITAILLKYRVPYSGPYWDPLSLTEKDPIQPMALQDAQRTIGLLRLRAAEIGINPHKIGVLGFSAGGQLVADLSTHFDTRAYSQVDIADTFSCMPNFAATIYPGHMLEKPPASSN
ncbi:MAG: alpha/beta hydrolase [Ignavibacteria bacterium]|nr:alpha/beta hydrolase [Ignavibacteria bacterium]